MRTLVRARKRAGLAVIAVLAVAGAGCASATPAWVTPSLTGTSGAGSASSSSPGRGEGQPGNTGIKQTGAGGPGATPGGQARSIPGGRPGSTTGGSPGSPGSKVRGVLFGGDLHLAWEEPQLGRRLAIVRVYDVIGERFLSRKVAQVMSQGSTVLVSLDTFPPNGPSYASIAAGHEDGTIRAYLESVEQAAVTYRLSAIYVTFEHEANNISTHRGLGSPREFVRAWDHVHQLAVSAHLDWNQGGRLHWVFILTHYGYVNGSAAWYWPGTGEVDVVGVDGYNKGGCRQGTLIGNRLPPVTPASLFTKAVAFAAAHGHLPLFVTEWGSVAYRSQAVRVRFIQQMQAFIDSNRSVAAAMYWDSQVPRCNYEINNSSSSLAALASMGRSFDMQGRVG